MVTCTGKSLIPINFEVYQKFMNSVIPPNKLAEFNIKLDARSNVKSVFTKLEGHDLTIYTGALVNCGTLKFPEISDLESLLMLFTLYGVKKAGAGVNFEIKTLDGAVAEVKADSDFNALVTNLHFFMDKFKPLNEAAITAPVMADAPVQQAPVQEAPSQDLQVQNGSTSVENTAVENTTEKASNSKTKKSAGGVPVSPFKDVPLTDTPKIDVPADLDLRSVE